MKLWIGAFGKKDFHDKVKTIFLNKRTELPAKYFCGDVCFMRSKMLEYAN